MTWTVLPPFISWVAVGDKAYYITDDVARTKRCVELVDGRPWYLLAHYTIERYYGVRGVYKGCLPWEYEKMPIQLATDMLRFDEMFAEQFARQRDHELYDFLERAPRLWKVRAARALLRRGASSEGLANIIIHVPDDTLRSEALTALVRKRNKQHISRVLRLAPAEWQLRAYEAVAAMRNNRDIMRCIARVPYPDIAWHTRALRYIQERRRKR